MKHAMPRRGALQTAGALVAPWLMAMVMTTSTGCDRSTKNVVSAPSPTAPNPALPTTEPAQSNPAPLRPPLEVRETGKDLTKEQERNQMPLPGQANDHSAPAATDK